MHNIYLEALLTKGIFGLLILLFIISFIFIYYFRHAKSNKYIAHMGMIHIAVIAIFGVFEDAPINKGNFASIFILYTAVFIASLHNHNKKKNLRYE